MIRTHLNIRAMTRKMIKTVVVADGMLSERPDPGFVAYWTGSSIGMYALVVTFAVRPIYRILSSHQYIRAATQHIAAPPRHEPKDLLGAS